LPLTTCPYVGLQPFKEEDYLYFFGRERDVRVIASNLVAQPLTVLYGPSGVGKSSVLRAGVLRQVSTRDDYAVIYHNTWQSESFLRDLTDKARVALKVDDQDATLESLPAVSGRRLFLLLDQFEELLLHHPSGDIATEFDVVISRLINRQDLAITVLVGIREDALSRFDQRYSIRIAELLGNTLPLDHLSDASGRRAILGPLDVFNERNRGAKMAIELELVDEILAQVQVRKFADADPGARGTPAVPSDGRVEAPFLQLVLRRLWDVEVSKNSRCLRLETLRQLGGARQIVDQHVNRVLSGLPHDRDRDIAASMFRYLVTPSRSKVSQATTDLIDYAEAPEGDVRDVLSWLSDRPDSRILRRLDAPERYEIFHDVLAQPILDWRRTFAAEKEGLEIERKQKEEAERAKREVRRLRWFVAVMALLAVVAGGLAWYAFDQKKRADEAAVKVVEATIVAEAERDRTRQATLESRANAAALGGQVEVAAELKRQAAEAKEQAAASDERATQARREIAEAAEGRDKTTRDVLRQNADLLRERTELESNLQTLRNEVDRLNKELAQEKSRLNREVEPRQAPPTELRTTPKSGRIWRDCDDCPEMIEIAEGKFMMGSPATDDERSIFAREEPLHTVSIHPFALGRFEVTRGQFQAYVKESGIQLNPGCFTWRGNDWGENTRGSWMSPGFEQSTNHPVVCVSWQDADGYVKWLSQKTKQAYRLPSEAEWEYAVRAGTETRRFWGNNPDLACGFENVADQMAKARFGWPTAHRCRDGYLYTAPVGTFRPNTFGVHDLLGNVSEWIQDCYHESYDGAPSDEEVWMTSNCRERMLRGGSWTAPPPKARSAARNRRSPSFRDSDLGFRVVRALR
jgi:formylglycine-generating enzyme required for sulfatase activity